MTKDNISTKSGLVMFFTLVVAYITFAASWVGGSNLGPEITSHFFGDGGVSPVISQLVNYTITIARAVANFLAAYFLVKLGVKKAASLAFVLLLFSAVAVWMPNYWLYIVARMIMALGGSMIMVYMNPIVSRFVKPQYKLLTSSLITATYNIGAFAVAVAFFFFADALRADWRMTLSIISAVSAAMFLIWLIQAKDFETGGGATSTEYTYKMVVRDSFVWRFSAGFAFFLFLYVMSLTSLPSTLAKAYEGFNSAYMILAVSGGGMVASLVLLKFKVDRPRRPYLKLMGLLAIIVSALGLATAPGLQSLSYVFFFLTGFFVFIQYAVFLNVPHELPDMYPQKATLMFGVIWALCYGIYTILTYLWSVIFASFGLNAAHIFWIAMCSLYMVAVHSLPETYKGKQ